jgi:hypothetical protein
MAKTTGPLFSLEASGTVGNTVVYSQWKGVNYVRRRVVPANPYEALQVVARNRLRGIAGSILFFSTTTMKRSGQSLIDKERIKLITPDSLAWNSFLTQTAIGANGAVWDAGAALYNAFTTEKAAWIAAAAALAPAIIPVQQGNTGGGYTTALTAGRVWFSACYGLYVMGLYTAPTGTPPTYA